jgi:hypothetical protein
MKVHQRHLVEHGQTRRPFEDRFRHWYSSLILYNYTPCAFLLKISDPLYCGQIYKIYPPPIADTGYRARNSLLQTYKDVQGKDRTAISLYWIQERCKTRWGYCLPGAGRSRSSDFWSRENSKPFLSKMFRKVNTGGPFAPARARFLRQQTTPNPHKLERTWGNSDIFWWVAKCFCEKFASWWWRPFVLRAHECLLAYIKLRTRRKNPRINVLHLRRYFCAYFSI